MKKATIFILLAVFLIPAAASAATVFGGERYTVPADKSVDGNIYIGAGSVTVNGTVTGDAVLGGGTIHVAGSVQGDILASGGTVNITGEQKGDIRIFGGSIMIDGAVSGDVAIAGGDVFVSESATILGDLFVAGGNAEIRGKVQGTVRGAGGTIRLAGPIAGDVDIRTGNLTLDGTAALAKNLTYTARQEAVIVSGATIAGTTTFHQAPLHPFGTMFGLVPIAGWVLYLAGTLALTLVLILMFPVFSAKVVERAMHLFWRQALYGFLFLVGAPIAAVLLFVSTIGWLLGMVLFAIYGLFLMVGGAYGAIILGSFFLKALRQRSQPAPWLIGVIGAILTSFIALVPFLGWLVILIFFLAGLGTFFMVDWEKMRT